MSNHRKIHSEKARTNAAPKPYCKVCHDAGKPLAMYTSHFVRQSPDPNSRVVCPTLLSQKCAICSKTGHTQSRCQMIAQSQRTEERCMRMRAENDRKENPGKPTNTITNPFDHLVNSDDDEEEQALDRIRRSRPARKEAAANNNKVRTDTLASSLASSLADFPALLGAKKPVAKTVNIVNTVNTVNYAAAAAMPAKPQQQPSVVATFMPEHLAKNKSAANLNWADMSDDDDDEVYNALSQTPIHRPVAKPAAQSPTWIQLNGLATRPAAQPVSCVTMYNNDEIDERYVGYYEEETGYDDDESW